MSESQTDRADQADSKPAARVLSYSAGPTGRTIQVGSYASAMEAALPAAQLEGEGIQCVVLNSNVNALGMPYSGMSQVELHVLEQDAPAARDILARPFDDVEPADDPDDAVPVLGDGGIPMELVAVGAFENMRDFREAVAVLASSAVRVYPPALRPRGNQPPGAGKRFILKVAPDYAELAESLLKQARVESENDDEPRCPECRSWRVYPASHFWESFKAFWGFAKWPQKQMECLACRYQGAPDEFAARR